MLGDYCNQQAQYQAMAGTNNRDEPIYADAVSIPCRKRHKAQELIQPDGRKIRLTIMYHLTQAVHEGDLLDGMRVQLVTDWVDVDGNTVGWRANT